MSFVRALAANRPNGLSGGRLGGGGGWGAAVVVGGANSEIYLPNKETSRGVRVGC